MYKSKTRSVLSVLDRILIYVVGCRLSVVSRQNLRFRTSNTKLQLARSLTANTLQLLGLICRELQALIRTSVKEIESFFTKVGTFFLEENAKSYKQYKAENPDK